MAISVLLSEICNLAIGIFTNFVVVVLSSSLDVRDGNWSEDAIVALVFFEERFGVACSFFSAVFEELLLNLFINNLVCLLFEF